MKKVLLASTFLVASAGAAMSADAVVYEQTPEVAAVVGYDWSGFYVGAAVGYAVLEAEDLDFGDDSEDDDGVSGAVYAGYNHQINNWVLGIEGDLKFSDTEVDDDDFLRPLESELAGSVRGRVGYAFGELLPYFTAGVAIGRFEVDHEGDGDPDDFAEETLTGYVVGGGLEWAATQNFIVRAEYLFSDYGSEDFDFYDGSDPHEIDVQSHDVRLGIAYKF